MVIICFNMRLSVPQMRVIGFVHMYEQNVALLRTPDKYRAWLFIRENCEMAFCSDLMDQAEYSVFAQGARGHERVVPYINSLQ